MNAQFLDIEQVASKYNLNDEAERRIFMTEMLKAAVSIPSQVERDRFVDWIVEVVVRARRSDNHDRR